MSIQTKSYKSKKTNKKVTKYHAVVFNTNTQKSEWSKGFDKKSEAKIEEAKMIEKIMQPRPTIVQTAPIEPKIIIPALTFEETVNSWIKASDGVYANSTMQGYLWYLKKYIYPVFKQQLIKNISAKQIQDLVNRLNIEYSAETVNKVINILSNVFNHAKSLNIVDDNIVAGIKRKKVILKNVSTWTESQIKSFLNYEKVIESDYYDMLLLIFCTGMRPSEVCGVLSDNLRGDLLILTQSYDRYCNVGDMKNKKSHRSIKLPEYISNRLNFLAQARKGGFLFVKKDGRPVNPNAFSKAFKRLLKAYNLEAPSPLPDVCLYDAARHSFGTNLIVNNEVPVSLVSALMGNSERVLQDRYVHVQNNEKAVVLNLYASKIVGQL